MKVTATIRKDRPDAEGLCPVLIRVNTGNKKSYLQTDIKVHPDLWSKGHIKSKHPQAEKLNQKIFRLISEVGTNKSSELTFEDFAREHIRQSKEKNNRSSETLRYYEVELQKFTDFSGPIPLTSVTSDLLDSYHAHLAKRGNSHNTIWKGFKFIKTIINKAINAELITKNPFLRVHEKINFKQTDRIFLNAGEVKKIAEAKLPERLKQVAGWFLFQCETGLAISDLRELDLAATRKDKKIHKLRIKTGTQIAIPLSKGALNILKTLKPLTMDRHEYNRLLKDVASNAGIEKRLSSHVGRHTFAIRLAELHISKETATALLGHKKSSTTDIYYKIQNKRVEEEFKGFGY